jgi:uncharacterized protein YjbI with pentapeptide repeats
MAIDCLRNVGYGQNVDTLLVAEVKLGSSPVMEDCCRVAPMKAEDILKRYQVGERDFGAIDLTEANLSGANLSGANLSGANLSVANLSGINLSNADLRNAKLNVARLSSANLSKANLCRANLNVANLVLADLGDASLVQAALVKAELSRAELSGADLTHANLSNADLKDAKLRQANLSYANLSRADLRWVVLAGAQLEQANLGGADLSGADLSGVDLGNAELRQANLSRANLSGANLNGANLRWADLTGADLRWADLSGAKLSGASLTDANLSHAMLLGTTLVHADLSRANLTAIDWAGADLSGATLTGARLFAVLPFGVKVDGLICDWIDLSAEGDQSRIHHLQTGNPTAFFHTAAPSIGITIDAALDLDSHEILATTYRQLADSYSILHKPPSLEVGRRRTVLTFEVESDDRLFLSACIAILPFQNATATHENMVTLMKWLHTHAETAVQGELELYQYLESDLHQALHHAQERNLTEILSKNWLQNPFFCAPTKTVLRNSSNHTLTLYQHLLFGKRLPNADSVSALADQAGRSRKAKLPQMDVVASFVRSLQQMK